MRPWIQKRITDYLTRENGLAVALAVLLNILLLTLMPALVQTVPEQPEELEMIDNVRVIRMNRPDTSVRKKDKPRPPEPEERKVPRDHQPLAAVSPPQQKIRLPFELNPRLKAGPQTLSVPGLDHLSLQGPDGDYAYSIGELDAPLTPVVKIPPMYPMRAKRLGIEGQVKVKFLVNEEGAVAHVEILAAEPAGVFDRSVINCVSRWRFKPGTVEGVPVKTWAETTIRFELQT